MSQSLDELMKSYPNKKFVDMGEKKILHEGDSGPQLLYTQNLATCLGLCVTSKIYKAAGLIHFPGSETNIYKKVEEFVEMAQEGMGDAEILIISPYAFSEEETEGSATIQAMRDFLDAKFDNNPAVTLKYLTKGNMAKVLAVGTGGEITIEIEKVDENLLKRVERSDKSRR